MRALDTFRRLLAAGLTAYLGVQSILIIGGTLRLLPLTGVTLPFVSYGGSSLLTSFLAILLLLMISSQPDDEAAALPNPWPYNALGFFLLLSLFSAALVNGWWSIVRGPDLLTRTDNTRRAIADRYTPRGDILDRNNNPITMTQGASGDYTRVYVYPDLAPVTGYTHPVFGQAGLEASMDAYLRGLQGNAARTIWWDHILYGQPPPGLDIRISIDLRLQEKVDALLGEHAAAVVMLNAQTGEILVMASHPTFNPNYLDSEAQELTVNPEAPLVNRTTQGLYAPGMTWNLFSQAAGFSNDLSEEAIENLNQALGFSTAPSLPLPIAPPSGLNMPLKVSPLQMALSAAALSHAGIRPAPRLVLAVNSPQQGWIILPVRDEPEQALSADLSAEVARELIIPNQPYWQYLTQAYEKADTIIWVLAGTPPEWQGTPLAIALVLEEDNPVLAEYIVRILLHAALKP